MNKPILQTLRALVEMDGQTTREDIVEWSDQSKPHVLQTLHRNRDLLKFHHTDSSIIIGDWCEQKYRWGREDATKVWWNVPDRLIQNVSELKSVLMNSVIFDRPEDHDSESIIHPDFDTSILNGVYFPRPLSKTLADSRLCVAYQSKDTISKLEKRGYVKKTERDLQIDKEIEEGLADRLWEE